MLGIFSSLKLYFAIGGLLIAIGACYIYIDEQKNYITLQKELFKQEKHQSELYRYSLNQSANNQRTLNDRLKSISDSQRVIDENYESIERDMRNEFSQGAWDAEIIPDNIYCLIECVRNHKTAEDCSCSVSPGNPPELSNEVLIAELEG